MSVGPTWVVGAGRDEGDVSLWVEGVDDDLLGPLDLRPTERASASPALRVLNKR